MQKGGFRMESPFFLNVFVFMLPACVRFQDTPAGI